MFLKKKATPIQCSIMIRDSSRHGWIKKIMRRKWSCLGWTGLQRKNLPTAAGVKSFLNVHPFFLHFHFYQVLSKGPFIKYVVSREEGVKNCQFYFVKRTTKMRGEGIKNYLFWYNIVYRRPLNILNFTNLKARKGVVHKLVYRKRGSKDFTFSQRLYHRKCQSRGVGGQK